MDLPIAYDIEDDCQAGLSKETKTAMINAFCSIIYSAGYVPMVYASASRFYDWFYPEQIMEPTQFWVAS